MQRKLVKRLQQKNVLLFLCCILLINLVIGIILFLHIETTSAQTEELSTQTVILTEKGFVPNTLSIPKGTTVIFTTTKNVPFWPASDLHPSHAIYSEFDPKRELQSSESWSFTFTKKGTWKYHDHLSPFFEGVITVQENENGTTETGNARQIPLENNTDTETIFASLARSAYVLIDQGKLDQVFDVTQQKFVDKVIPISECHTLFHLIGHKAYTKYGDDFSKLARKDSNLCGGAFQHGIEAEIVLQGQDIHAKLFSFCEGMQQAIPGVTCFHGAGHAYMNTTLKSDFALKQCDLLGKRSSADSKDCYRGVFSELAFQVTGIDGDTGLPYPGGPRVTLPGSGPLAYCNSLEKKYQYDCGAQLSRILEQTTAQESLAQCVGNSYSEELQSACIQIISAVIAQKEFAYSDIIAFPPLVSTFTEMQKKSYLEGILGEYRAYNDSGMKKNGAKLCQGFTKRNDQKICNELFKV